VELVFATGMQRRCFRDRQIIGNALPQNNSHFQIDSDCILIDNQTTNGWAPLHIAVRYGKLPIITYLLENGHADPSLPTSQLWTPLHIAAELESSPTKTLIIELLLSYHSNPNALTNTGLSPLFIAVNKGDAESVKVLVNFDADVNFQLREKKLVEIALAKNFHEIVGTLLQKGANVGSSVLWEAVRVGNISLVENLLQGEADVNFVSKGWSIFGNAKLLEILISRYGSFEGT
jgi:ankyrin repeat protein